MEFQDTLEAIQKDILDHNVPLSAILLKAKVLAHQLKNESLKQWVKWELDGYPDARELPDYRLLQSPLLAHIIGPNFDAYDIPIDLNNMPDWFRDLVRVARFTGGVTTVEELSQSEKTIYFAWSAEYLQLWAQQNASRLIDRQLISVRRSVEPPIFAQILQTVRSRLQDLILELDDAPWKIHPQTAPPEQVQQIVNKTIYNLQGANVTTFHQQNQQVGNQSNAGRDVNNSGQIQINTNADLLQSVRGLRDLMGNAPTEKQTEIESAIGVLEQAAQEETVSKGQVVQAVETVSQVPTMRDKLESLAWGATAHAGGALLFEVLKFYFSQPS